MLVRGQDPGSLPSLRDAASYPALYDDNAVFLGEFDYLVRKRFYNPSAFLAYGVKPQKSVCAGLTSEI